MVANTKYPAHCYLVEAEIGSEMSDAATIQQAGGDAKAESESDASTAASVSTPASGTTSDTSTAQAPVATALQDLIAGGAAGSASVVVGHPFDTYKVRLHTSRPGCTESTKAFGGCPACSVAWLPRSAVRPL